MLKITMKVGNKSYSNAKDWANAVMDSAMEQTGKNLKSAAGSDSKVTRTKTGWKVEGTEKAIAKVRRVFKG